MVKWCHWWAARLDLEVEELRGWGEGLLMVLELPWVAIRKRGHL